MPVVFQSSVDIGGNGLSYIYSIKRVVLSQWVQILQAGKFDIKWAMVTQSRIETWGVDRKNMI